jgi:RNA polymerase sigma-70 factor, ECF subfamily
MFLASRTRFVRVAYSILRNREDAEDAVQDAFLSACRHLRSFEGRSTFTTWFTRIVVNAALIMRRKRKTVSIEAVSESRTTDKTPWTERIPDPQPDPEMVYKEEETRKLIDAVVAKMSPILQQAFAMTYYDELSSAQAGASLGIAAGTFKARLFRARRYLAAQAHLFLMAPSRNATANDKQSKHILWNFPNYRAVTANTPLPPLSSKDKFWLATQDSFVFRFGGDSRRF